MGEGARLKRRALRLALLVGTPLPVIGLVALWAWLNDQTGFAALHGFECVGLGALALLAGSLASIATAVFVWPLLPGAVSMLLDMGGIQFTVASLSLALVLTISFVAAVLVYGRVVERSSRTGERSC